MTSARYVIIGAGFAGAATAYHLARSGAGKIMVVEQERVAGVHASGRNASMIRQIISEPSTAALAYEGAAFLRSIPADWPVPVSFEQNGSLLLGQGEAWKNLIQDAEMAKQRGIEVELWSPQQAQEYVPVLKGANLDGAVWCPSDGVVDIYALLTGYIKAAMSMGTEFRYGSPIREINVKDDSVTGIVVEDERIDTEAVINAAGAWAGVIGQMAGAAKVPLRPLRRHLFVTPPLSWVDPRWPFVWDVSHDFYFRPDSGGLLLCPCDQDEMEPGIPPTDESKMELLADKVRLHYPAISDVPIKTFWAGLRTFSPDGRFVVGWDHKCKGFFWLAGLGGHGVTTSSAVGSLAARLILNRDGERAKEFDPERFQAQ